MERNYQYRGDLRSTTLPEMLQTIYRTRVAGVIEARRGEIVKRIWVKDGDVVHATSNDREDSLGAHLERTGRLAARDIEAAQRLRQASRQRLGELLVERELLSPATIHQAIREQNEEIVWSLFAWPEGEVTFSLGGQMPRDMVRILIPMRQVILQGIRRAPDAKPLVARLGRRETVFAPSYTVEDLIEIALDEAELKVLRLVNGRRNLFEVCTQGPLSPPENGKLVYAFHLLQLVRLAGPEDGVIKIKLKTERES